MRIKFTVLLFILSLLLLSGCTNAPSVDGSSSTPLSVNNNDVSTNEDQENVTSSHISSQTDSIRNIIQPTEIMGTPERIILVRNEKETMLESGTEDYDNILKILEDRMPNKFDEAACAFVWMDENWEDVDWALMAKDFDYLLLEYDVVQNIKINCMDDGYDDYEPEVSFQDIIFPLTACRVELGNFTEMCIVGRSSFFVN